MYGAESGMIIGQMKRKIERYRSIVATLLNKQELDDEDKAFLKKEKVL